MLERKPHFPSPLVKKVHNIYSMTEHYELTYILAGNRFTDENYAQAAATVTAVLTDNKAGDLREEVLGKKKLAYPIRHEQYGYYITVEFNLEASALPDLNNTLRLQENVLRHLIIKKKAQTEEEKKRAVQLQEQLSQEASDRKEARYQREKEKTQRRERPARPATIERKEPIKPEEAKPVDSASLEKKLDEILKDEDSLI